METENQQLDEQGEVDEPKEKPSTPLLPPAYRKDLSVNYVGGLFLASIALLLVGVLGVLSWWVTIPVILVMVTTLFEGWGRVSMISGGVVAGILLLNFMSALGRSPEPEESSPIPTQPQVDPFPPIDGSLGVYVDQVTDLWNTVEGPPRIQRGLTHQTESGELDTFIYRFGEWGRLIGAYNDETKAMYALLATGQLSGAATDHLYIHLCFVVASYSQECLEFYQEQGLNGGNLEDFVDIPHTASWTLGNHSWNLEVDQNVLSIRVYGEDIP